jgi:hypothetical protein
MRLAVGDETCGRTLELSSVLFSVFRVFRGSAFWLLKRSRTLNEGNRTTKHTKHTKQNHEKKLIL